MKEGWEVKKLTDVCNIQYGYAFDSSCFCDDNSYPQLIRIRDVVRGYSETFYNGNIPEGYYINKGDYLIGMDGEFHIAPWQSEKALLNQRVCKISASDCNVDERFIFYKMSVVLKQIEDETPFVTVKHLSAKRLNQVKIPIPPLPEQSRIVEELDLLSNIIEKKRQQLSELENLAQTIFYDMFGDPVTNEKGWEVKKLGEVCKTSSGGTPSKSHSEYYEGGIIPWLRSGEVNQMYISKTELFITEEGLANSSAKWFPENTVVIAMYGATVGQVGILCKIMTTNQAICGIFPNESFIPIYLYHFLLSKKEEFIKLASGGAQPNISQNIIRDTLVCCPKKELQQLFAQKVEAIEKQKELIKQSIAETEQLFNSRMDYYFS